MYPVEFITDIRQLRLAESEAEYNEANIFLKKNPEIYVRNTTILKFLCYGMILKDVGKKCHD